MQPHDAVGQVKVPAGVPAARERATAGSKRARRTRSPHPGVVLIKPDAEHAYWRARYTDPDTGRSVKARLDPVALGTKEARREWATRKARSIARRHMDLESGAPKATGTALETAVARYYEAHPQLRERTLAEYKSASDKLLAWAAKNGVQSADDLTRAKLLAFRETLLNAPKRRAAKRGKRGAFRETKERRSPATVNRELRGVRVVLGYLAELDLLPRIHEGDLRRALKRLALTIEAPTFLRPAEIAALLEAAAAYDAEMYKETRAEHAGDGERGSTARYEPIAPFVATLLLTGMRLGEAIALTWGQVDLEALEIRLAGASTKTKRARSIDLTVSDKLRELLAALHAAGSKRGKVFALTSDAAAAAAKRLRTKFDAPETFSWQVLRSTCGTYLTNAPGIFGAASAYRSARQLGHSVAVAEKHYLGVIRVPAAAKTLEDAMTIGAQLQRVIDAVTREAPQECDDRRAGNQHARRASDTAAHGFELAGADPAIEIAS